MVLFVENAILTSVFLNAFVMALVFLPMYVNFTHCVFLLSFICFGLECMFFAIEVSSLLLYKIRCMVLFSFFKFSGDNWYVFILLKRYRIATNLCSLG